MGEALIIAIVGQVVTLIIVILQQVFNIISMKQKSKNENRKHYFQQKINAYKLLIDKINIDIFDDKENITERDLDFFHKEVFLYASDEIVNLFNQFNHRYLVLIELLSDKEKNKKKIDSYVTRLGYITVEIHNQVRKEISML